jgi:hypothetical protein
LIGFFAGIAGNGGSKYGSAAGFVCTVSFWALKPKGMIVIKKRTVIIRFMAIPLFNCVIFQSATFMRIFLNLGEAALLHVT